jgi:hypothetical protein
MKISIFLYKAENSNLLNIFQCEKISKHTFHLNLNGEGLAPAINALEYALAGHRYELTIKN